MRNIARKIYKKHYGKERLNIMDQDLSDVVLHYPDRIVEKFSLRKFKNSNSR
jgi:hypothetical protein